MKTEEELSARVLTVPVGWLDKTLMNSENIFVCVELCPEYIDHLKRLLKPYISQGNTSPVYENDYI